MSPVFPDRDITPLAKRAQKRDDYTFIKHGSSHEIQREVDTIFFIQRNTSIPVPTVIESHVQESGSWFSMVRISGLSLTDTWMHMSEEAQATTQRELSNYLKELRAIYPPEPSNIGSCIGGPAYDHRLNNGLPCGPFASVSELHDVLVAPVARCPRPDLAVSYRQQLADDHDVIFTHADLCGDHILVDPSTGKITGIIDWEMAGWWPAYWEYTKSRFGNRYMQWWKALVGKVLDPYPSELRIERILQQF
jgi:aminoglycoside phosphotransferase (APT) family kinase protein